MMNLSNLLDLKQNKAVMVSWGGLPLGFRRKSGVSSLFAVWHWLLCSWHLRPFHVSLSTLLPVSFLLHPLLFYMETAQASLCVCVHVCACIYVYREIYMWGSGREWSAAQGLQPGDCALEPVICLLYGATRGMWVGPVAFLCPCRQWALCNCLS